MRVYYDGLAPISVNIYADTPSTLTSYYKSKNKDSWNSVIVDGKWNGRNIASEAVGIYTYNADGTAELKDIGFIEDSEVIIPAFVEKDGTNYTVTSINVRAFYYCSGLTSVIIPNSVTSIGAYAFEGCSNLENIEIPDSVAEIGGWVFFGCTSLINIYVAPENPNYSSLEGVLFNRDGTVLIQYPAKKEGIYTIPEGVISFGDYAFYNCTGLTSLVLPESMNVLGQNAFYKFNGLQQIHLPSTLEAIGEDAFFGCVNLQEINIPDTVTSIGAGAFANCKSLEVLDIPAYVKTIGDSAFYRCEKLKFAYIPDSCVEAGSYMFKHCYALETVIMGAGIKEVQDGFFLGCGYIKEEYYQNNHGDSFFMNCGNLKEVYFLGDNPGIPYDAFLVDEYRISMSTNAFINTKGAHKANPEYFVDPVQNKTPTLYYLNDRLGWYTKTYEEALDEVRNATYLDYGLNCSLNYAELKAEEGDFESDGGIIISYKGNSPVVVVPNILNGVPVTEISEGAFLGNAGIYVIILPETVTVVGERAFAYCPHLKTVQFRGNAPEAPENIFEGDHCVVYYEKGTTGWDTSWKGADVLTAEWSTSGDFTYEITDNEATITGYTGVSPYLEIPSEIEGYPVTQIGEEAFFGKFDIFRVHIPGSVTSIGFGAFANCRNLLAVELGGTTEIADSAFYYCKNLPEMVLPETLEEIGSNAFLGCESLKSINIPDGVSYVGNHPFYGCDNLPPIMFSTGEKVLVRYSLLNEDTTYTVPDTVNYIASSAFSGCTSLTNVVIPDSVTCIDYAAFYDCSSLTSVTIGNGVTEIQDEAFRGCSSLASIEIPDSVTYIGERAFAGCSNLTNIEFPDGITEIQDGTFMRCASLKYVIIPDNVTSIGGHSFYSCSELWYVIIPESVTSIGGAAFYGCYPWVYFKGNSPTLPNGHAFDVAFIQYRDGTTGWTDPWDGCSTHPWANPVIMKRPQSQSVMEGDSVTFSVVAAGMNPLTYQWHKDGVAIEGAVDASYTIESVTAEDLGNYSVLISDQISSASVEAALTLTQPYRATATLQIVDGAVVGLTLTDGGWGYTRAPKVRIRGGAGKGFEAHCIIENGVVVEIVIDNPGSGYSEGATLLIGGPKNNSSLGIGVSKQNGEVKVKTHLALGMKYQLWSSTDCVNWEQVGEPFTAEEEELDILFQAEKSGKYFKLQEI
ncbi:MAG: leucine-rich repeat protein [Parabacteroides sp.]|nr:leucine-rich repeat protein [Parabacteroides sp.]